MNVLIGDDGPCRACGEQYPAWRAPDELWNLVMGGPEATDDPGGMLCPNDFLRLADQRVPQRGAWVIGAAVRPESAVRIEVADEIARAIAKEVPVEVAQPGHGALERMLPCSGAKVRTEAIRVALTVGGKS